MISPRGTVNNKPRRTYRHKISSCFCASVRDSHRMGGGDTPELRRGSRAVSSSSIPGLTPLLPAQDRGCVRVGVSEEQQPFLQSGRHWYVRAGPCSFYAPAAFTGPSRRKKVGEGSGAVCSLEASFSAARGVKGCLVPHGQVHPSAIFTCAL